MSHFCVLVVTDKKPTKEILEKALEPYHEFECTGENNDYVEDVDVTEEYKQEYEKYKNEGQSLTDYIQDEYSYKTVLLEVALDYEGEHKWGYIVVDLDGAVQKIVRRTNPNKKWDWWQVGGRFSEFLIGKPHVFELARSDDSLIPGIGEPGIMGSKSSNDGFDIIRKGDVDLEGMRGMSRDRGLARWDRVRAVTGELDDFIPWPRVREELFPGDINNAREFYHAQRAKKALHEAAFEKKEGGKVDQELAWVELEDYVCSREAYGQKCWNSGTTTFAMLKDGEWFERGKMGWWATVSDEKDPDAWDEMFTKMLDEVPEDSWLSVIDCHI